MKSKQIGEDMAALFNIHETKAHLSKLLLRVMAGEEIVITKAGKPIAKIIQFESKKANRVPGSAKGKIWIAPDLNTPLPNDILDTFEGQAESRI